MKKISIILMFLLSFVLFAQTSNGYIKVQYNLDTLTISHIAAHRNCASKFKLDLEIVDSLICLIECDTVGELANCMCYFDLITSIELPPPGQYRLIIQTTNVFERDTALVIDTCITITTATLVSHSTSECLNGQKTVTGQTIPIISEYESSCINIGVEDLYIGTGNDNLNISWSADSVQCNSELKWQAILSGDTLHLSVTDTSGNNDCYCDKYIDLLLGPIPSGKYILNFLDGKLGYPVFIIDEKLALLTEDNDLIINWDVADLNCCLQTKWEGWLEGNIFHVTMTDTGAPCDCLCPFELSARFGPFIPGKYTLDFSNTSLGKQNFTIEAPKSKTALTVISFNQSECYDPLEINENIDVPKQYALLSCYPNPFNPISTILYYLPGQTEIRLDIINIKGDLIQTLVNDHQSAGTYTYQWNAANYPSGIYFVVLKGSGININKKVLLLK